MRTDKILQISLSLSLSLHAFFTLATFTLLKNPEKNWVDSINYNIFAPFMPSKPNSYPLFNKIFHLKPTSGILHAKPPNLKNEYLIPHNPPPTSHTLQNIRISGSTILSPSLFIRNNEAP